MFGFGMARGGLAAMAAVVSAGWAALHGAKVKAQQLPPATGYSNRAGLGKNREPGKPGRAGDKLRRMASERRLGMARGVSL